MREFLYTTLARVRGFLRPDSGDADFDQEMDTHLAMAEEDKIRRGLSRDEARREARIELGGVAQLRESARAARGLPWLDTFWLDGKLGVRMLRKSWGLTLVGGLAMAVTIGLGASMFTIWNAFAGTRLPLDEGDRVVAMQPFDKASQRVSRSTPRGDFRRWRDTLRSVETVSAMRPINPMVITRDGPAAVVSTAEMTASAFQLARVQPLLGRPLIEQDERDGADPVAVIGYDVWQSGFSSDPAVLGQRIKVGETTHIIVGVMPERFRFPMNQHLWTALRTDSAGDARRGREDVFVFGRLTAGATLEIARAEVATIGLLPRDTVAGTTVRLEPRVVPYAAGVFPEVHDNSWATGLILLIGALLLVPPCANIAILVYARTVTRRDEFAARSALGASRARIVMQVFIEVLVLASGAGIVGFLLAQQDSLRLSSIVTGMGPAAVPFWMDFRPSFPTVLCVAGLSVLAAAIAGAVPAFHATGRWRKSGFHGLGNRTGGGRLGKTWTSLLAAQVALSLAILPSAGEMTWGIFRPTFVGPGLPIEQFLTGSLVMEGDPSRLESLRVEAVRQLTSEAGISGVTASAAVLMQEPFANIELDRSGASDAQARFNTVDDQFFEVFGARFLAGRRFDARDFSSAATAVIVNRSFVDEVVGGENALGRRVRYVRREDSRQAVDPAVWYEIVGVVQDFPGNNDGPMMYHPMAKPIQPMSLTIRSTSGVGPAAARLRAVSAALDPNVRLGPIRSLSEIYWQRQSASQMFGFVLGSVMAIVFLFSMAGMYTLMAFIVAQRWREIGLRSAMGAQPHRLLVGIFGRAVVPLLVGAIAGSVLAFLIESSLPITEAGGQRIPGVVPATAALMVMVGLLAVAGPARRAIRVNPTEALRVG